MIKINELQYLKGFKHGFFTREGGVSSGLYDSLNCSYGSGDQNSNVDENRRLVLKKLGLTNSVLRTCHQKHSATAVIVSRKNASDKFLYADGMVTDIPGIVIGILTADCAPILFLDTKSRIIGAAHAGWQGAINGILESTIYKMNQLGAVNDNIKVAIGPCIGRDSYEIGPEFYERFLSESQKNERFFIQSKKNGHHKFDLAGYVEIRLRNSGIKEIYSTNYDTFRDEKLFFSYRRSVLLEDKDYGREISAIAIEE